MTRPTITIDHRAEGARILVELDQQDAYDLIERGSARFDAGDAEFTGLLVQYDDEAIDVARLEIKVRSSA